MNDIEFFSVKDIIYYYIYLNILDNLIVLNFSYDSG